VCHDVSVTPLPAPDARAFRLDAALGMAVRGAAICLHGYTGTPYEVRPLADVLAARGFTVHAPLLTGHGSDPAVCNRTSWRTWLDDAVSAYDDLDARTPVLSGPRVVVGSSMGGLLALHLSLVRRVDALVLLAPALAFFPAQDVAVAALGAGLWRARPFLPKEAPGGDVGDATAQRNNPTYKVLPSRGVVELWHLQRATRPLLPRVTTPVCALHGDRDGTIDPTSAATIVRSVSAPLTEHHRLAQTRHLVGLDVERDVVAALALRFIDDVWARSSPSEAA
jgi:carboxylesterase